jgi:apolipoprotein N-acyltransferase
MVEIRAFAKNHPGALLICAGGFAVFLSSMRAGVSELGWVAFAPFLVALHRDGSLRCHLGVLAMLLVTFTLAVSKIVTEEISWGIAPMFGLPSGVASFAVVAIAGAAHRRLGPRWGIYSFAAMTAALGWVKYSLTPGSSWGSLAHTQVDHPRLLQLAALTGLGGITFVVALGSSMAAAAASSGSRSIRKDLLGFAVVLGAILLYGEIRLASPAPGPLIRVGGVISPVTFREFSAARKDLESLRQYDAELFARTERAAELGATVLVWNENATLVTPESEAALVDRGRALARRRGVLLLMAYGVVTEKSPPVNKYRIYLPDGTVADEYLKRHPLPGDGDVVGHAHARVIPFGGVNLTGAICYDYDFPHIARDNASDGAGLVLVPSGDWRGIDPFHGRMAIMNAVAAGVSLMRPVRGATSVATDQYGRWIGSMPAGAPGEGVLVSTIPGGQVPTFYAKTGEIVPLASLALVAVTLIRMAITRSSKDRSVDGGVRGSSP